MASIRCWPAFRYLRAPAVAGALGQGLACGFPDVTFGGASEGGVESDAPRDAAVETSAHAGDTEFAPASNPSTGTDDQDAAWTGTDGEGGVSAADATPSVGAMTPRDSGRSADSNGETGSSGGGSAVVGGSGSAAVVLDSGNASPSGDGAPTRGSDDGSSGGDAAMTSSDGSSGMASSSGGSSGASSSGSSSKASSSSSSSGASSSGGDSSGGGSGGADSSGASGGSSGGSGGSSSGGGCSCSNGQTLSPTGINCSAVVIDPILPPGQAKKACMQTAGFVEPVVPCGQVGTYVTCDLALDVGGIAQICAVASQTTRTQSCQ